MLLMRCIVVTCVLLNAVATAADTPVGDREYIMSGMLHIAICYIHGFASCRYISSRLGDDCADAVHSVTGYM